MKYTASDIAHMIDISALKFDTTKQQVDDMIVACHEYGFGCAFVMSSYSAYMKKGLEGSGTEFGTSLGFPSGQYYTGTKVQEAEYFVGLGADQVDMVLNVGWLKSGMLDEVEDDIRAVRKATQGTSLKVIIEASLLTDEEIRTACRIVCDCGANYVKSGTGFSPPTTLHHVRVMAGAIGGRDIRLKVAGGVSDLRTLLEMREIGADRFGIGMKNSIAIVKEAQAFPAGVELSMLAEKAAGGSAEAY